jgi:glyoxylase-like metal-dependent hydrolase (beta-lactamase superfamily II)
VKNTFMPLPRQVLPEPDDANGYRLQRAGENGYVVIAGFIQSAFVVTGEGVVLVDAPPALDGKLQAAITSVTDQAVTAFIYTHSHMDHVGAVTKFRGAARYAHEECARMLAQHNDPARPVPDQRFDGPLTVLNIGGEEIHLAYPSANHEVGNILVHFPAQRLSIMTDLVMPGWAPYRAWGNADYPPGILAAHDAILATDFDTYVGGHVYRTGTRADVEQSRELFVDMVKTTKRQMGDVSFTSAAAEVEPANSWAAQTVWINRVARAVTEELIDRWGGKIAAMDTFTPDTVGTLVVSLTQDAPVNFP